MHDEFQQLIEAEWTGALDESGRRRLTELAAADPALTDRLRQERRLSGLLGRLGPNHAPQGLGAAVFARLDTGEEIPDGEPLAVAPVEQVARVATPDEAGRDRARARVINIGQAMRKDHARTSRPRQRWLTWTRWSLAAGLLLALGVEVCLLLNQENSISDIVRVKLISSARREPRETGPSAPELAQPAAPAPTERTVAEAKTPPATNRLQNHRKPKTTDLKPDRTAAKPSAKANEPSAKASASPAKPEPTSQAAAVPPDQNEPTRIASEEPPESDEQTTAQEGQAPAETQTPPSTAPVEDRVVASAQSTPAVPPMNETAPPVPSIVRGPVETAASVAAHATEDAAKPSAPVVKTLAQAQALADADNRPQAEPVHPTSLQPFPSTPAAPAVAAVRAGSASDQMVAMRISLAGASEPAQGASNRAPRKNLDALMQGDRKLAGGLGMGFATSDAQTPSRPAQGQTGRLTAKDIEIAVASAGGEIVKRTPQDDGSSVVECSMTPAQLQKFMALLQDKKVKPAAHPGAAGRYEVTQGQKLLGTKSGTSSADRKVTVRLAIRPMP